MARSLQSKRQGSGGPKGVSSDVRSLRIKLLASIRATLGGYLGYLMLRASAGPSEHIQGLAWHWPHMWCDVSWAREDILHGCACQVTCPEAWRWRERMRSCQRGDFRCLHISRTHVLHLAWVEKDDSRRLQMRCDAF